MSYRIHIKDGKTNLGDYGGEDAPATTISGDGAVEFVTLTDAQRFARKLTNGEAGNGEYSGMKCTAYSTDETE